MFDVKKLVQDALSYVLAYAGAALGAVGGATHDETAAVTGGVSAAIGIIWRLWLGHNARKMVAIVAEASDTKKTTADVIASPSPVKPIGTAAPASGRGH